jgi:hypothetical protein
LAHRAHHPGQGRAEAMEQAIVQDGVKAQIEDITPKANRR